jgi:peptidoglycan/LPS O-acetylase OafA/YrhL
VWRNPVLDRYETGRWFDRVVVPLAFGSLFLLFLLRAGWFRDTVRYTLQGIALAPVFIAAIRYHRRWPFRVLNWKWVRHIGTLSYTLYLVHYMVLLEVENRLGWGRVPTLALSLLIALAIAQLVHWLIERPIAGLRRKLSGIERGRPPARPADARPAPGAAVAGPG